MVIKLRDNLTFFFKLSVVWITKSEKRQWIDVTGKSLGEILNAVLWILELGDAA